MRRQHFETLRPLCPVCRGISKSGAALRLAHVIKEEDEHILEGALHCTNPNCLREFPIIDGIPLIIAKIREYISQNVLALCDRRDLSEFIESMVEDCCGPGSAFDQTRQFLSSYAWDHYGDLDPLEQESEPRPGSVLKLLQAGLELISDKHQPERTSKSPRQSSAPIGPVIDLGCSVGRGAFALAARTKELVLGVDMNFAMLRLASEVLRTGTVRYPRRRVGIIFDRREFAVNLAGSERVDFWACDAAALPFAGETFSLAVALNTLDSVQAPRELLESIARILKPSRSALLSCPYDWSAGATPLEGWLGGHSQRAESAGSPENILRNLLTPRAHAGSLNNLKLTGERENLNWTVRLHDRSAVQYKVHLIAAKKIAQQ